MRPEILALAILFVAIAPTFAHYQAIERPSVIVPTLPSVVLPTERPSVVVPTFPSVTIPTSRPTVIVPLGR
jgi:hypothetical protein